MSLSERLRKARTEKLLETGLLPHDHVTPLEPDDAEPVVDVVGPEPVVSDDANRLFEPITIEARPASLHLVVTPLVDLTTREADEDSATCPTCHAVGIEDMVDLVGHTVHYTCASCSTMWQVHTPVAHAD